MKRQKEKTRRRNAMLEDYWHIRTSRSLAPPERWWLLISAERRNLSWDSQLARRRRARCDVTRIVFKYLHVKDCIGVSHVCAYWRWLAINDPLLWTVLDGQSAFVPVLWARTGSEISVDVNMNLSEDTLGDVAWCIATHFTHMTSLTARRLDRDSESRMTSWAPLLDALSQPKPASALRLARLELDLSKATADEVRGLPLFPMGAFAPMSRLRELALIRTSTTSHQRRPNSESLPWVCGLVSAGLTESILDYFMCQDMHSVAVSSHWDRPMFNFLSDFHAQHMYIRATDDIACDLLVMDAGRRRRHVHTIASERLGIYPALWSSLILLTVCNENYAIKRPEAPTPHLKSLTLYYRRRSCEQTIDQIFLWRPLDLSGPPVSWSCHTLQTVTFAVANQLDHEEGWPLKPITLLSSAILDLVTCELANSNVSRVIIAGDSNTIQVRSDAEQQLPFELLFDTSAPAIPQKIEMSFDFEGFSRE
ncbi:hypothetical protein EXIGLDRAFT_694405 [Exidia glandulosa HHB12029]|uniref:F-box domain-containing protein n=1 Tax=Exidia glandulosa HHB12029 TaxID=1314781 RepID=A0A165GN87_EXIGL|nr:hypothetical protein EXIGLDRAFT_694405 [Exidia glandulosa HHB12029]